MTTYTAQAQRSGEWWAISVPEVPGVFSQAKRLDRVADTARDAIALFLDVPPASFDVSVEPVVASELQGELEKLKQLRAESDRAAADYAAQMRSFVARTATELSQRDVAALVMVSFQRINQILAEARLSVVGNAPRKARKAVPPRKSGRSAARKVAASSVRKVAAGPGRIAAQAASKNSKVGR
jgi:predicted RNase H-like HicB family nuclease